MLSLPTSVRIYLARGATDMRKSIDGLAALTAQALEQQPMSGHLFVFCNRDRDRIKILYWERSGFWLLHNVQPGTWVTLLTGHMGDTPLGRPQGGLPSCACWMTGGTEERSDEVQTGSQHAGRPGGGCRSSSPQGRRCPASGRVRAHG